MNDNNIFLWFFNMWSSEKKRKVVAECGKIENSRTKAFIVIEQNESYCASYVTNKISAWKEYNFLQITLLNMMVKFELLKKYMNGQQVMFKIPKGNSETVTKISYMTAAVIAKRSKSP